MSKQLGSALRFSRESRSYTQQQMADAVGVSRAAIGQWEAGQHEPSTENLIAACEFLGIDLQEVIKGRTVFIRDEDAITSLKPDRNSIYFQAKENARRITADIDDTAALDSFFTITGDRKYVYIVKESFSKVPKPYGLGRKEQFYCIINSDNRLFPRFEIDQHIYIDKEADIKLGDYVVVKTGKAELLGNKNSEMKIEAEIAYVGRLASRNAFGCDIEHFNPPESFHVDRESINAVHRIVLPEEMIIYPGSKRPSV